MYIADAMACGGSVLPFARGWCATGHAAVVNMGGAVDYATLYAAERSSMMFSDVSGQFALSVVDFPPAL